MYTTLLAVFQVFLHRYSHQDDLLVGSPSLGRERAELHDVVGYFVNPVVIRGRVNGDLSFKSLLGQVRQTVLDGLAHAAIPFQLLVERLQPERELDRSPLFQTMT